jgi:hypothetical protein
LSEHFRLLSIDPHLTLLCHVGNAEVVNESAWVQLCGPFAVEFSGRRIDNLFPGRQGRLLFAYLTLSRLQAVSRETRWRCFGVMPVRPMPPGHSVR